MSRDRPVRARAGLPVAARRIAAQLAPERFRALPLESDQPVRWFATLRILLVLAAALLLLAFDYPGRDRLLIVVLAAALPWALAVQAVAARRPALALSPAVAVVDLGLLVVAQVVGPDSYAGVRFLAIFLIAAHAHFQGEHRGLALAAAFVAVLAPLTALVRTPIAGELHAFTETLFAVVIMATGLFVGRLRAAESVGRVRARELSRRTIEAETTARRRLAEGIHDGPVQELASQAVILDAARRAVAAGDLERAGGALVEARRAAERAVGELRDEIVGLAPYASEQLSLDASLEQCVPVWERRYSIAVKLSFQPLELAPELRDSLFRVAQEAVTNAGRHANASAVELELVRDGRDIVLRVRDNGQGFGDRSPLGPTEPSHIGLASMRASAEVVGGTLSIESSASGTTVTARVPGR